MSRPYVLLNVAATADGKIDTIERRGAAISSERDRQRVDELRASVDAVMVGGRTLLEEDPRLTVRSDSLRAERVARGLSENPAKVGVLSSVATLRLDGRFLNDGPARVILFAPRVDARHHDTSEDREDPRHAKLRDRGVEVYLRGVARVDLVAAMDTLAGLGFRRVLVEGGGTLNFELLQLGLVDELQVFIAPLIFGGATAPTLADGAGLLPDVAVRLKRTAVETWDDGGVLLRYKVDSR